MNLRVGAALRERSFFRLGLLHHDRLVMLLVHLMLRVISAEVSLPLLGGRKGT
jgi:hypothetical protein